MTSPTNTQASNKPANAPAGKPADKPAGNVPAGNGDKPATTGFSLASLSFEDTAAPVRKPSRTRDPKVLAPFIAQLRQSWEKKDDKGKGSGKAVTVPKTVSTKVVGLIRHAADALGEELKEAIGTSIVTTDAENGNVRIQFCAKKRRGSDSDSGTIQA
jgi:hypothetical protein